MKWLFYLENDEDDVVLLRTALNRVGCRDCIEWFRKSDDLKMHLLSSDASQFPSVILIDLKLTGEYGLDVATWISEQPALNQIQTFIFSSGRFMHEITAVLERNAMGYLFKPSRFEEWIEIAQQLKEIFESTRFQHRADPRQLEPQYINPASHL